MATITHLRNLHTERNHKRADNLVRSLACRIADGDEAVSLAAVEAATADRREIEKGLLCYFVIELMRKSIAEEPSPSLEAGVLAGLVRVAPALQIIKNRPDLIEAAVAALKADARVARYMDEKTETWLRTGT